MKIAKRMIAPIAVASSLLVSFGVPKAALAWGGTGHEAVAFVAWQQMNSQARIEALKLLKQVPQIMKTKNIDGFAQWQSELPSGLSADDQNMFLFMRAATWADSIKHVGLKDSDDPPVGVSVDKPQGFSDPASHGYWHFVDRGLTTDKSKPPATPVPDAAVQIVELRKDLASETDPKMRAYELVWLLHLVGDIHQPLHGVRRFVNNQSDLGGNDVAISLPADLKAKFLANRPAGAKGNPPTELHAFWDDLPGVTTDPELALKPAQAFAKALPAATRGDLKETDPSKWADHSFDLAVQHAYVSPVGPLNKDAQGNAFAITDAYYNAALPVAQTQLSVAGARLAKMLNDLWPAPKNK
jgi:hypothetical protein